MNADFENRLQRQPIRELPRDWRSRILASARPAFASQPSTLVSRLSSWFWPCPRAWAGLGFAWLLILGLNMATGKSPADRAQGIAPCSTESLLELRQQQLMLAKLLSPLGTLEAEPAQPGYPRRSEIPKTRIVV